MLKLIFNNGLWCKVNGICDLICIKFDGVFVFGLCLFSDVGKGFGLLEWWLVFVVDWGYWLW